GFCDGGDHGGWSGWDGGDCLTAVCRAGRIAGADHRRDPPDCPPHRVGIPGGLPLTHGGGWGPNWCRHPGRHRANFWHALATRWWEWHARQAGEGHSTAAANEHSYRDRLADRPRADYWLQALRTEHPRRADRSHWHDSRKLFLQLHRQRYLDAGYGAQ